MLGPLFILLLVLSLLTITENLKLNEVSNNAVIIIGLCLVVLVGFRDGSSMPDYQMYKSLYHRYSSGDYSYIIEPTFLIITQILNF